MGRDMAACSFAPMTRADLPLFKHWLDQPHLGGWWGDSATEARLVENDIGKGVVDMRLACHDGVPFACIQANIQDDKAYAFGAPQDAGQPQGARAIDTFPGDPAFPDQGHGSGSVAARLRALRRSFPVIVTNPDPTNTRAGFRRHKVTPCENGDPVQVMTYT